MEFYKIGKEVGSLFKKSTGIETEFYAPCTPGDSGIRMRRYWLI